MSSLTLVVEDNLAAVLRQEEGEFAQVAEGGSDFFGRSRRAVKEQEAAAARPRYFAAKSARAPGSIIHIVEVGIADLAGKLLFEEPAFMEETADLV